MLTFLEEHFLLLSLMAATAVSITVLFMYRKILEISGIHTCLLAFVHTFMGVVSVKIFGALETSDDILNASMSLFGAIFFLPLFYFIYGKVMKKDIRTVFDILSICLIGSLMCVRGNCIVSGCCMGLPIPGTDIYWPTREAEIVFWIIIFLKYLNHVEKKGVKGNLYPKMMAFYGVFRFIEEFFRQGTSLAGALHISHIWAIISFCIGSTLYFWTSESER